MKLIWVFAVLGLVGCADQPNMPSDSNVVATVRARPSRSASNSPASDSLHTTVSGRNVADITRDVQGWHDMQHADCKFVKVSGAEIVSRDEKSIVEHWTIEACKQQAFTYKVLIIPGTGALTDAVSNLDGSGVKASKP